MNYKGLIRSLELPSGYTPPRELRYEDITARAISRADLVADVKGINASLDIIRRTRGGEWPSEPVTDDFDYVDLVWHELEFREHYSFAYAVYDTGGQYLGCCYLYPMGRRTPLDESDAARRRRELVGHPRRVRPRLLRQAPPSAPSLGHRQ